MLSVSQQIAQKTEVAYQIYAQPEIKYVSTNMINQQTTTQKTVDIYKETRKTTEPMPKTQENKESDREIYIKIIMDKKGVCREVAEKEYEFFLS